MRLYRNFTSQEEIDLEYDLALTVPDLDYWIDWYTQEKNWTEAWHDAQVCRDEIAKNDFTFMRIVDEIETVIKKGA